MVSLATETKIFLMKYHVIFLFLTLMVMSCNETKDKRSEIVEEDKAQTVIDESIEVKDPVTNESVLMALNPTTGLATRIPKQELESLLADPAIHPTFEETMYHFYHQAQYVNREARRKEIETF